MLKLKVLLKGLDGIGDTDGEFFDLIVVSSSFPATQQIFLGTSVSYSAAKTLAASIFKASLTWDDTALETAAFTA